MDMRARRFWWALTAAFLLLSGPLAVSAGAASIDPELVVESVSEDGYYVDSAAPYFKSDADLDQLREALDGKRTAGVLVLPAGADAGTLITQLLDEPNRHATYVALAGTRLEAASNILSRSAVNRMVAQARQSGTPKTEVLSFLDSLNPKPAKRNGVPQHKGGNLNMPSTGTAPGGTAVAPAAAKKSSGGSGNGLLYGGIGGLVVLALAGSGGYVLWRRGRKPAIAANSPAETTVPGYPGQPR